MKRSLRFFCALSMLALCLVSCSGHRDPRPAAPAHAAESPAPVSIPSSSPTPAPDPLETLLCLFPWGAGEELSFEPDGSGVYRGLPVSWELSGGRVYIRVLPDISSGRRLTLRLEFDEGRLSLYGGGLVLPVGPTVNREQLRLQRLEERRLSYIALQRTQGEAMAQMALGFVGGKYKYGGKSPDTGFDCSGMIWYIYDQFGYTLERVAAAQAKQGMHIEPEELLPGDLLAFYTSGKYVGHVGMYVGNGYYVHAMGEAYGVVLTALDDPYLKRSFEARRLVGQPQLMKNVPEDYLMLMFPDTAQAASDQETAGSPQLSN